MTEQVAFFLTWVTYGTWLPGDSRGWVEYQRGWQLPDLIVELESAARMPENVCCLTPEQRQVVEAQIAETCDRRGWHLHAVNCRSNHIHVVVTATGAAPRKIRTDLKAWASRKLRESFDPDRTNWWAERGSIRFVNSDESLEAAVIYVLEGQDRKRE